MIGSVLSDTKSLLYGVLKGSVLGPILYSLHTTPLSKVIQNHPFMLATQLYVDLTHKNVTQAFNRLKTALIASKSGFLQISLSLLLVRQNLLCWLKDMSAKLNKFFLVNILW